MPANFDRSLSIPRSKNGTVQKIICDMHTALLEHFVVICCHVYHKILGWSPCKAQIRNMQLPETSWSIQICPHDVFLSNYIQPHAGVTEDELHVPAPKGAPPVAKNATASWIIQQTMCTEAPQPAKIQNCPVQVEYWTLTRTTTPTWPMSSWLALSKGFSGCDNFSPWVKLQYCL